MAATESERSRAKRLRKKKTLTDRERDWLETYKRNRALELAAKEAEKTILAPEPAGDTPDESEASTVMSPSPAGSDALMEMVPIEFPPGETPSSDPVAESQEPPDDADRTALLAAVGPKVEKPKRKPMSVNGSRAIAGGILTLLGFVIKLFRSDRRLIPPTEKEVAEFAEAIKEIAETRAPWLSTFDDFMAAGWIVVKYMGRAVGTPTQKKGEQPAPQPEPVPS